MKKILAVIAFVLFLAGLVAAATSDSSEINFGTNWIGTKCEKSSLSASWVTRTAAGVTTTISSMSGCYNANSLNNQSCCPTEGENICDLTTGWCVSQSNDKPRARTCSDYNSTLAGLWGTTAQSMCETNSHGIDSVEAVNVKLSGTGKYCGWGITASSGNCNRFFSNSSCSSCTGQNKVYGETVLASNCLCVWESGSCKASYSVTSLCNFADNPSGSGNCYYYNDKIENQCESENPVIKYSWEAKWQGGGTAPAECKGGNKEMPCGSKVKIPFFSILELFTTLAGVVFIYLLMGKRYINKNSLS